MPPNDRLNFFGLRDRRPRAKKNGFKSSERRRMRARPRHPVFSSDNSFDGVGGRGCHGH